MPEGPSIVLLKEALQSYIGKRVITVNGNAKIDMARMLHQNITDFKSWGKHFLICFNDFFLKIHLLMFGSYRINEQKTTPPRLSIGLENGEINFYNCSVMLIEGDADDCYDWETDVMSEHWNALKAEKNVKEKPDEKVCDLLLDQEIFSGVGNIIKNEVLFRTKIHPESLVKALPVSKVRELIYEARNYSLDFYEWKKIFELKKHWLIYKKGECPRCKIKTQRAYLGKTNRLTCFCNNCQMLYTETKVQNIKKKNNIIKTNKTKLKKIQ